MADSSTASHLHPSVSDIHRPRRLPVGAEFQGSETTDFRVWAPVAATVSVVLASGQRFALHNEGNGYYRGTAEAMPGTRYQFQVGTDERLYPDPASRYQPEGPHGPSEIVDPSRFQWTDDAWRGVSLPGQVLYELHVGTFTP